MLSPVRCYAVLARWDVTVVWCSYMKHDTFYYSMYFNGVLLCDLVFVSTHETCIISFTACKLWDHLMVYFLDLASLIFDLTSMDLSIYEKSITAIFTFFSL